MRAGSLGDQTFILRTTMKLFPAIQTQSLRYFNFVDPQPDQFTIEDIAHALSHICRFAGHTRKFYSVAQHCTIMSYHVPPMYALHALLHDAAEAFLGDIPTPLKQILPEYKVIERRVEKVILDKFGITYMPPEIKEFDTRMLVTEQNYLMPEANCHWAFDAKPLDILIRPAEPAIAKRNYLTRFEELSWNLN